MRWGGKILNCTTSAGSEGRGQTLTNVDQLIFHSADVWDVHVVGRGRDVFILPLSENVSGHKVHLGMSVLSCLRSRHVDDLRGWIAS
jgi:hypothetical protein